MVEPVNAAGHDRSAEAVTCPWCGASTVERTSMFGPRHMVEQWFCRDCRSPFERIRKRG